MKQLAILNSSRPFIWLVESRYRVGRSHDCDLVLTDEMLEDIHLELKVDGDNVSVAPVGNAMVKVNDAAVQTEIAVNHGDCISLGRSQLRVVDPKFSAREEKVATPSTEENAWVLQGLSTALRDKRYPVSAAQVIGRARECDICLGVAHLSRQHARLTPTAKGLWVEDLGSANGTYINNKRTERALLKSGDELRFDTLRFAVLAPGAEADPDKTSLRPAVPVAPPRPASGHSHKPTAAAQGSPRQPTGGGKPTAKAAASHSREAGQLSGSASELASSPRALYVWLLVVLVVLIPVALWFVAR